MDPDQVSTTERLAARLLDAWQRLDVDALVGLLTPDATLDVDGGPCVSGTADVREALESAFLETKPLRLSITRTTTSIEAEQATVWLNVTLARIEGATIGPLPVTISLRRDGERLSRIEVSDVFGASASLDD